MNAIDLAAAKRLLVAFRRSIALGSSTGARGRVAALLGDVAGFEALAARCAPSASAPAEARRTPNASSIAQQRKRDVLNPCAQDFVEPEFSHAWIKRPYADHTTNHLQRLGIDPPLLDQQLLPLELSGRTEHQDDAVGFTKASNERAEHRRVVG